MEELLEKISKDVVDIKKMMVELEECYSINSSSTVYKFFSFKRE